MKIHNDNLQLQTANRQLNVRQGINLNPKFGV